MGLHLYPIIIRGVNPPVAGLLSRPTEEFRPLPTVIFFHGLNGSRSQVFQGRYQELAEALQRLECNLLSVELRGHGERRENKTQPAAQNLLRVIAHRTLNPFAGAMEDIAKIVEFTAEKKIAPPEAIAVAGISWGALSVFYALHQEPRVLGGIALLPVCRITDLLEFRRLQGKAAVEQYDPIHFTSGIAPKPLLFITGEKDTRANPRYASELYERLLPDYEAAGAASRLAYIMLPGAGHAYIPAMTAAVADWIKTNLVEKCSREAPGGVVP
ncbi:MAG: alpha/beta hydrolase family protein [bacterium]